MRQFCWIMHPATRYYFICGRAKIVILRWIMTVIFRLSVLIARNWPIISLWRHFENSWCHFRQNGQLVAMGRAYRWWRSFIVENLILLSLPCVVDHAAWETTCLSFSYLGGRSVPHIVRFEKVELTVFEAQYVIFIVRAAFVQLLFQSIRPAIWIFDIILNIITLLPSSLWIKKWLF